MTTKPFHYFCVHGHFHQPPRGNPVTGDIGVEPDAGKYRNWNERITIESYRPNAEIGNFDRISFDVGQALMAWLKDNAPDTYARIVQADQVHYQVKKAGNALAGPYHDVLLPLRRVRERRCELYWGRVAFEHHFGRQPLGIWLPELAMDMDTLELVEALGYRFIILAQGQVYDADEGAGPYWIELANGRRLAAFVRDDELSNDLSFNISAVGGAGHWARNKLARRRSDKGLLTLVATDGETFGHHHLGEERFLHWLLEHEAPATGYKVTTLEEFLMDFPPRSTIGIKPFTSWGSTNSVSRWYAGWKGLLWRALDNLSEEMTDLLRDTLRPLNIDPWRLREEYVRVDLGQIDGPALLAEFAPKVNRDAEARILALLRASMHMAKSYATNAFLFEEFDRRETRYVIANAAYGLYLAEQATGIDLASSFRSDLRLVRSEEGDMDGSQVYDSVMAEYILPPPEPDEEVPEASLTDEGVTRSSSNGSGGR